MAIGLATLMALLTKLANEQGKPPLVHDERERAHSDLLQIWRSSPEIDDAVLFLIVTDGPEFTPVIASPT